MVDSQIAHAHTHTHTRRCGVGFQAMLLRQAIDAEEEQWEADTLDIHWPLGVGGPVWRLTGARKRTPALDGFKGKPEGNTPVLWPYVRSSQNMVFAAWR